MAIAVYVNSVYIYRNESMPFGCRQRDYSSEILTDDYKRWLAQQLLDNLDTKGSLAQVYNSKPHTLQGLC